MVGLENVNKNSISEGGNEPEFLDKVPTNFSVIMASVVGLEVVDKSSTARK